MYKSPQFYQLSFIILALSLVTPSTHNLEAADLVDQAKIHLEKFVKDPKSAMNSDPIRDYSKLSKKTRASLKDFRAMVKASREQRNADEKLSVVNTRDIVIKRSGRVAEQKKKRAWYDNDDPALLLGKKYVDVLTQLPTSGRVVTRTGKPLGWSNDYWALKFGSLSIRYFDNDKYKDGIKFQNFAQAFNAYSQPYEYKKLIKRNKQKPSTARQTDTWSAAEKYDLLAGDTSFSLTNYLKDEPLRYTPLTRKDFEVDKDGQVKIISFKKDVAKWMGKCHGWAAAATIVPRIIKDITLEGANGDRVHFHPDDIRGLVTLKWAQSPHKTRFVGGRCNKSFEKKEVKVDPITGAIYDQDCFDVNPATFHTVTANSIGLQNKSIVMDATFDAEVWNHPIRSFDVVAYFKPSLRRRPQVFRKRADGSIQNRAIIPYGRLGNGDRFRELREKKWKDAHAHSQRWIEYKRKHGKEFRPTKILGVITKVTYLMETYPKHGQSYGDELMTAVYLYDLELDEQDRIVGGEWYFNKHPDFLWQAVEGKKPLNNYDIALQNVKAKYDGTRKSLQRLTTYGIGKKDVAQLSSSNNGAPLGTIVDFMVGKTSEK